MTVIGENQKLVVINKKENVTVTDKKEKECHCGDHGAMPQGMEGMY